MFFLVMVVKQRLLEKNILLNLIFALHLKLYNKYNNKNLLLYFLNEYIFNKILKIVRIINICY